MDKDTMHNPFDLAAVLDAERAQEPARPELTSSAGRGRLAVSRLNLDSCIGLIGEGRPAPVIQILDELERDMIALALAVAGANIRTAAALIGLKYTTLYAKIRKHGLHPAQAVRCGRDGAAPSLGRPVD
jgi:DNA-binding NtrC family response regulator